LAQAGRPVQASRSRERQPIGLAVQGVHGRVPHHPTLLATKPVQGGPHMLRDLFRKGSVIYTAYDQFERIISVILLITIAIIIVYATGLMMITLAGDFHAGLHFAEQGALKDTFGLILSLLILIEFNHSLVLAVRRRSGIIEVRVVILIAIIVIARKLILLDYANTTLEMLLGLGGLALSLGALYWLLTDIERRRPPSAPAE
jgi:uncharacterized membrane protein (DUF373 family)